MVKKAAFLLVFGLLALSACTKQPAQPAASGDSLSGTWSGEYGPGSDLRDSIRLELHWENANLRGLVHAGVRSMPITKASFQPDTGDISLQFDAEGNGGRTVHYVVDGKVNGNMMSGTWSHDDQHGEFRVTKQ